MRVKCFNIYPELPEKYEYFQIEECSKINTNLVKKYKRSLDWCLISSRGDLSDKFIKMFRGFICWDCLFRSQAIYENTVKELINYISNEDLEEYIFNHNVSMDFIKDFLDRLSPDALEDILDFDDVPEDLYVEINRRIDESN